MAQNSNHFASNSISLRILSHLIFFELKKVSHFGKKTRDPSFEEKIKEKWMVRILSHLDFKCKCCHVSMNSFDDFLSHLTIPPVFNKRFLTRMPQQAFQTMVFMVEKKTNLNYLYAQQAKLIPSLSFEKSQGSRK